MHLWHGRGGRIALGSAAFLALVATASLRLPAAALSGGQLTRPNIILILSDDQTLESIHKMPFLRRRIPPQGGWYRFDNAFINNATCCPSRATILTGQWSHHHGVETTSGAPPYDDSDTIATRLHAVGYRTGFVGKYHLGVLGSSPGPTYVPPGWDDWQTFANNTPGWYYNYTLNENGTLVEYGSAPADYSTDVLRGKALRFIARSQGDPFFLIYAPRAPHNDWVAAPRDLHHYRTEPVRHRPNFNEPDMSDKPAWWSFRMPQLVKDMDAARRKEWDTTLALDDAVQAINHRVRDLGLTSRTAIVFMTDNGYAFGEHRYIGKECAYEECSHTPLLVKYRGHSEGWTFPQLIGNEDLAPTFARLAGVSPPDPSDGQSFVSILQSRTVPVGWENEILLHGVHTGASDGDRPGQPPTYWGLRKPRYKYIETVNTGEVELYDLSADPYELRNVAGRPKYARTRSRLAGRLQRLALRRTTTADTTWVDAAGNLTFHAGPGAKHKVVVNASGDFWLLTDLTTPVRARDGCGPAGVARVRCPAGQVSRLVLNGNDKDDILKGPDGIPATAHGRAGVDALTTGDGSDYLSGGDGADVLNGGRGPDVLDGGERLDTVTYATRSANRPVEIDIDGAFGDDGGAQDGPVGARDSILASVENLTGGNGRDLITGSAEANVLVGRGGADRLRGLAGNDTIHASGDGAADAINCGAGKSDAVFADPMDIVVTTGPGACEIVN